jgi:spermidine synthase
MQFIRTRGGVRLKQQGVVVCELRSSAGPTHSVFDVLAALMVALPVPGPAALPGFSAGGMVAPLTALGWDRSLAAMDLDAKAFAVFRQHCPQWRSRVELLRAEAGAWLRRRRNRCGLLVEGLSVPEPGNVVKPAAAWNELPELIRRRLRPEGVAVFNLLPDPEHP